MLKQVWFHIHGKSPEQTTKIMTIVLKKFKFIKVKYSIDKCIIESNDVPDSLNCWIIDILLKSKVFLGKFHEKHPLFTSKMAKKIDRVQLRIQTCISRFGFWDSIDYPEDKEFGDFLIRKTQYLLKKTPLWKAIKMASQESTYEIIKQDDVFAHNNKMELINNLTQHHNTTIKQATEIINREFPQLADVQKPERTKISQKEIETINEKTRQLIETLKFYSPKNRRKYLDDKDNFDKFVIFAALFQRKGKQWIIENIGEVENWT
jgi:DNA-directed RNA polymerase beta subunit